MFCCFDFFGDPLCLFFGQRLEFLVESAHAGDAGAAVADVVDYFVGRAEDFAGLTEHVGVPGIRLYYPEHWLTPDCALIPLGMLQPLLLSFSVSVTALRVPIQMGNYSPKPASACCLSDRCL